MYNNVNSLKIWKNSSETISATRFWNGEYLNLNCIFNSVKLFNNLFHIEYILLLRVFQEIGPLVYHPQSHMCKVVHRIFLSFSYMQYM